MGLLHVTPILSAEALAEGAFCLGRIVVDYLDSHQTGRQRRIWERAVNQIGLIVKRAVKLGLIFVVVLLVTSVSGYALRESDRKHADVVCGRVLDWNLAPELHQKRNRGFDGRLHVQRDLPEVGPLYFYASNIPAPGSHTTLNLQNVTTGNIELPSGVQVSYPTGQAIFGTSHAILTLRVTLSQTVTGTVGLVVGAFQQVSQAQVVGYGSGFDITVNQA